MSVHILGENRKCLECGQLAGPPTSGCRRWIVGRPGADCVEWLCPAEGDGTGYAGSIAPIWKISRVDAFKLFRAGADAVAARHSGAWVEDIDADMIDEDPKDEFTEALLRVAAEQCGLQDPREFATARGGAERSGRSTETALRALLALQVGCEVEVRVADPNHAGAMLDMVMILASKIGMDRGNLQHGFAVTCHAGKSIGRRFDLQLVDHSVKGPG
jgi:hypothetical protein